MLIGIFFATNTCMVLNALTLFQYPTRIGGKKSSARLLRRSESTKSYILVHVGKIDNVWQKFIYLHSLYLFYSSMNKSTLIFIGLSALFTACKKKEDIEASQCYDCSIRYNYKGAAGVYVPASNSVTYEVCGTADRDSLLKRNGTSDYGPGGFSTTVTQAISCSSR